MSYYSEALMRGLAMSDEERTESLKSLTLHPQHYPALLAELWIARDQYQSAANAQEHATHTGVIQHSSGSAHALEVFKQCLEGYKESAARDIKDRRGHKPKPGME